MKNFNEGGLLDGQTTYKYNVKFFGYMLNG